MSDHYRAFPVGVPLRLKCVHSLRASLYVALRVVASWVRLDDCEYTSHRQGPEFDRLLDGLLAFVHSSLPNLALVVLPQHTGAFVNDEVVELVCVSLGWNRLLVHSILVVGSFIF